MNSSSDLRAAAERYWQIARTMTDRRIADALSELAAHYEFMAIQLETEEKKECASCSMDFS